MQVRSSGSIPNPNRIAIATVLNKACLSFLFLNFYLFTFIFDCAGVFVATHGLSLVVVSRGYYLVLVCRLFMAAAYPVAEHGL